MKEGPFHAVRTSYNDKPTGYAIYVNNEPYLVMPKRRSPKDSLFVGRAEAQWIVGLLNDKLSGKVRKLSREELAAIFPRMVCSNE